MTQRTVILHYHLFKNAGTSVDRLLKDNFAERWVTREFPANGGNNSALVADWITSNPEAVAFSSHTMLGPLPVLDGVEIISVIFLRDPIARIISAYTFERHQAVDTLETKLAKEHDLEGYLRARLAIPGDRQCRNFQTNRLASFVPGPEVELERATKALKLLTIVGRVESFDASIAAFAAVIKPHWPAFQVGRVHANQTKGSEKPLESHVLDLLEKNNRADRALLAQVPVLT